MDGPSRVVYLLKGMLCARRHISQRWHICLAALQHHIILAFVLVRYSEHWKSRMNISCTHNKNGSKMRIISNTLCHAIKIGFSYYRGKSERVYISEINYSCNECVENTIKGWEVFRLGIQFASPTQFFYRIRNLLNCQVSDGCASYTIYALDCGSSAAFVIVMQTTRQQLHEQCVGYHNLKLMRKRVLQSHFLSPILSFVKHVLPLRGVVSRHGLNNNRAVAVIMSASWPHQLTASKHALQIPNHPQCTHARRSRPFDLLSFDTFIFWSLFSSGIMGIMISESQ